MSTKNQTGKHTGFKSRKLSLGLYPLFIFKELTSGTGIKNILFTLKGLRVVKKDSLFDDEFYLKKYEDVSRSGQHPLLHYIYHGIKEGRDPNPYFNGNYYLEKYPDVKKSGRNPFLHYVLIGRKEGRFSSIKKEKLSSKYKLKIAEKKITKLETSLNDYNKKITKLETSLNDYNKKITKLETSLNDYNKKITKLETSLNDYNKKITKLETSLNDYNKKITKLETSLNDYNEKTKMFENRTLAAENKITKLERSIQKYECLCTLNQIKKTNKIILDFINSNSYSNKKDYLIEFKRCMWRYDYTFKNALKLSEFNEKEQVDYFNEFVDEFNKCNYLDEFKKEFYEPYFDFMDKKYFKSYLYFIKTGFKSDLYWENRYKKGGNSGVGSYNFFSEFKADTINKFVETNKIKSVIEFGSGDGSQLKLANYKQYTGFDVSKTAVSNCKEIFKDDKTKEFHLLDEYSDQKADLTLSLDVIYHLVEDGVFEKYMKNLFESSNKYVIIYSSADESLNNDEKAQHVKHRDFTKWICENLPNWQLIKKIPNKYPYSGDFLKGSFSDFYFYKKLE